MRITAAICTRDRPDFAVHAVESVLDNTHSNFELIVVDQSRSDRTGQLLETQFGHDARLRYIRTASGGVSPARNLALAAASGEAVAFTDDDCVVRSDWLETVDRIFTREPDADMLYGQVLMPPELADVEGEVPTLSMDAERRIRRGESFGLRGMTANCAVRRRLFAQIAGFDEALGPGRPLHSGEDFDLNYRAYQAGALILLTPEMVVDHYGIRAPADWQSRLAEYGFGDAAFYLKHVRCGDIHLTRVMLNHLTRQSLRALLLRPGAAIYLRGFARGAGASLRFLVSRRTRLYAGTWNSSPESADEPGCVVTMRG